MESRFVLLKRPTKDEGEDDIERLQQEFLSGNLKPSVEVKRVQNEAGKSSETPCTKKTEKVPEDSKIPGPVLFDIVERDVVSGFFPTPPMACPKGFPEIPISKNPVSFKGRKGKKSIFSQRMESTMTKKAEKISLPCEPSLVESQTVRSYVIDGSGLGVEDAESEARKIHEENLAKLSSLPKETIIAQQKQILQNLSPDLVNFLKNRRRAKPPGGSSSVEEKQNHKASSAATASNIIQSSTSKCSFKASQPLSGDPHETVLKACGEEREGILLENMQEQIHAEHSEQLAATKSNDDVPFDGDPSTSKDELPVEELPINPNEAGRWVHMDKVEKDKLQWMTLLPKPKPVDSKSGYAARFDFQGKLLSRDDDIPTIQGLHHHSNEPEVPGYSVEELFLLARSSFQSQRITALETLSHILENYWNGCYDECFETPLLSTLLQSGLVPLLRWALDDATVPSIAAALLALHQLLICKSDEMCLDWTFCWTNGHISPFLTAKDEEGNINLDELTDAALIKLDVIKGLLRMDILPRFRYILRVTCPPSSVCQILIEICIRIARHSSESARKVFEFPGILEAVFMKFLPVQWSCNYQNVNTADYFCPMPSALKLVRVIALADKELALNFVKNRHLESSSLKCYLTIDPSDKKLPPAEVQKLVIESLRTWHVFLCYGLCTGIYLDLYPLLLRNFQFCQSLSLISNPEAEIHNYQYASHFLKAMEAVVINAGSENCHKSSTNSDFRSPVVSYESVAPLLGLAEACLNRWLWEFSDGTSNQSGRVLLSSCLDFMHVFLEKSSVEPEFHLQVQPTFEKISSLYLRRFLMSVNFSTCLSGLSSSSVLLHSGISGCKRDARVLTSLGSILWGDDILPVLKDDSCFPLVTSVICFIEKFVDVKPDTGNELAQILLEHSEMQKYLKMILEKHEKFSHWFVSFEVSFIFNLLQLSAQIPNLSQAGKRFWYGISLQLICHIKKPFEWYARMVLETVIFNPRFLSDIETVEGTISAKVGSESVKTFQLKEICDFYAEYFVPAPDAEVSRCLLKKNPVCGISALACDSAEDFILDRSWTCTPIYRLYQQSKAKTSEKVSPENSKNVQLCLEWINWNLVHHTSLVTDVKPEVWFCHLCLVFLIDGELFMVPEIKKLLSACLTNIIQMKPTLKLKHFSWKDLSSFETVFIELVDQFEAVSYGDSLFGTFVTYCLQRCYPNKWRKLILSEHPQAIRFLGVKLHQLPVLLENFLEPPEKDTELLKEYFQALCSGLLNNKRSPLLFLMAIHHLHAYLCQDVPENVDFQKLLLKSLKQAKQKVIAGYVLNYVKPNVNCELGFDIEESGTQRDVSNR